MAKTPYIFLSFSLLLLLSICSSGTELGFAIDARESVSASSLSQTLSFLELNKVPTSRIRVLLADFGVLGKVPNSRVSFDHYLDENLVKNLTASRSSAVLWLKTHVASLLPHVNIRSITLKGSNDLSKLLSSLKSIHSVVSSFEFHDQVKVSAAFSFELLENLNRVSPKMLHQVLDFIEKTKSFVIVEVEFDNPGYKLGKLNSFLKSKHSSESDHVDLVITVKCLLDPSENKLVEFREKLFKSVVNSHISDRIVGFYVEVESIAEKERKREEEQIFPSFRRELETVSHESVTFPPNNPIPNIVTVPATNPVTITPNNPASTPLPIPSTTPVIVPPANPVNQPVPITNPVTTPAPFVNPVGPPATTNGPAVQGQSWCVAKTGASQTMLQLALDYACGMGGADCSPIQQGGSCFNPNTLQNHASFAFNSYYQKNPVATSCDFKGAATLVSTNPSTGSCVFPSSASQSTPLTPSLPPPTTATTNPTTTPTTNPAVTPITTNPTTTPVTTNPATTPATPVTGDSGFGTPPSLLNSSSPGSDFGFENPPGIESTSSAAKIVAFRPIMSCIITVAFFFARMAVLDL